MVSSTRLSSAGSAAPSLRRSTYLAPQPSEWAARSNFSSDGRLLLRTMVYVGREGSMEDYFNWQSDDRSAQVGSVEAKMLEDAVRELTDTLKQGVNAFVNGLPAEGDH